LALLATSDWVAARAGVAPADSGRRAAPSAAGDRGPDSQPRARSTPAWLEGAAANQWVAIPGTALSASTDLSAQIAAGLTNAGFQDIGYGDPRRGIMAFSGGALKTSGSEMLIFGGGGAGAWAGNDVRSLRLEDDLPRWKTRVKPSSAASVWRRYVDADHAYMKDGRPNARHSYRQPQFIDAIDSFYTFGCRNTWEKDSSNFVDVAAPPADHYPVNSVSFDTEAWAPAGAHPDLPRPEADDTWTVKNPVTEEVYASTGDSIYVYSYKTNAWSLVMGRSRGIHSSMPSSGLGRCLAAFDSTHERLLLLGWPGASGRVYTADLGANTWTTATLSGPYASAIVRLNKACPLIYDPGIDKYLLFLDDGFLYTLTWMSNSSYSLNRLSMSGTPPVIGASTVAGATPAAIWSRMQYVPNLEGVCIVQAYNKPAYFARIA